jgi:methionine-rich copper-binding protein CopC
MTEESLMLRYLVVRGLVVGFVGLLAWGGAGPASAHNSLEASNPRNGSTASSAPESVLLDFDDKVLPGVAVVVVQGPGRERYEQGKAVIREDKVRQPLKALEKAGKYTIAYRVVSADGHPITGKIAFTLAAANPPPAAEPDAAAQDDAAAQPDAAQDDADTTDATDTDATDTGDEAPDGAAADGTTTGDDALDGAGADGAATGDGTRNGTRNGGAQDRSGPENAAGITGASDSGAQGGRAVGEAAGPDVGEPGGVAVLPLVILGVATVWLSVMTIILARRRRRSDDAAGS